MAKHLQQSEMAEQLRQNGKTISAGLQNNFNRKAKQFQQNGKAISAE